MLLSSLHSKHLNKDKQNNDCNQWKNGLSCAGPLLLLTSFCRAPAALREEEMEGNVEGRAVITVESLCWCWGKTTDREALYNRRSKTEEKLYAQEQECAGSNERGKVL